jgi:hypothetical protein
MPSLFVTWFKVFVSVVAQRYFGLHLEEAGSNPVPSAMSAIYRGLV